MYKAKYLPAPVSEEKDVFITLKNIFFENCFPNNPLKSVHVDYTRHHSARGIYMNIHTNITVVDNCGCPLILN